MSEDQLTANAFAFSWNNLPLGSVYTEEQVRDWLAPVSSDQLRDCSVLEMGCGNGSLMVHVIGWKPSKIKGIDLGESLISARANLSKLPFDNWEVDQADLTKYKSEGYDFVYCIGVLHHLKQPEVGFKYVVANVNPGGRFHCWVYAWEGNGVVRYFVEPIRKVVSKFPWWVTKYLVATPLAVPFYLYAKLLSVCPKLSKLPLYDYCLWIARREFLFFRHVAFDQLVTPQTQMIKKSTIQKWLDDSPAIESSSTYIIMRNGNSWKFGGNLKNT